MHGSEGIVSRNTTFSCYSYGFWVLTPHDFLFCLFFFCRQICFSSQKGSTTSTSRTAPCPGTRSFVPSPRWPPFETLFCTRRPPKIAQGAGKSMQTCVCTLDACDLCWAPVEPVLLLCLQLRLYCSPYDTSVRHERAKHERAQMLLP